MLLDKWILQFTRQPGSSHDERFIESVDVLNKKKNKKNITARLTL